MNLLNVIRDWTDPLPPTQTAENLEELQAKLREHNSSSHDIAVTWVPSLNPQEQGRYRITPVRSDCCWREPATEEENAKIKETKQVMRAELRAKLNKLTCTSTVAGSKIAAAVTTKGSEQETERKRAATLLTNFIKKMDSSFASEPDAPLDREYFQDIFSQRDIQDITESEETTLPSEKASLLEQSRRTASLSRSAATAASNPNQITENEVNKLVSLINKAKTSVKLGMPDFLCQSRKAAFNQSIVNEPKQLQELVKAIRKGNKHNWIDASFNTSAHITANIVTENIIAQFSD